MDFEMLRSSFVYAAQTAGSSEGTATFLKIVEGNDNKPSELFRGVQKMLKKYVEHLRVEAGDRWRHKDAEYSTFLWLSYAAYILAGLYAIYGRTLPRIRSGLVEEMERGDIGDILEKLSEREALLCSFGNVSKDWIAFFRRNTDNDDEFSTSYLCPHGIACIYALGAAIIYEMKSAGDDTLFQAEKAVRLNPSIERTLEEILERMEF